MLQQKAEKYAKKKEHSEDALAYCNNYGAYRPRMSREEVADYYSSWADKYEIMLQQKAEKYAKKKEHSEDALAYCNNYGAYRPGTSREEVADYYSSWADKYEIMLQQKAEKYAKKKEHSEDALAYCNNYGAYRPGMSREEVTDYYSSWVDKYEIMLQQKAEKYAKKKEHSEDALAYCNNYGAYRPGMSREEVADYYSSWADKYEIMLQQKAEKYAKKKEHSEDALAYCNNYGAYRPGMSREEVTDYYSSWVDKYEIMLQQKAEKYAKKKEHSEDALAYCNNYGAYRPGMSREEVADYYSSWADKYEIMIQQKAEKYAKKKEHSEDALAYCNNYGAYRPGMSREEVTDYYSSWVDKYEIMLQQKAEKYAKKKEHSEDALAYCNNYGAYRPGMSREEVADYYSSWADKYEIINVEISELSNQLKEYRNLIPELLQSARADNTNKKYFYCFPRWIKWAESNNIDCIFPDLSPERYNGPIICCNVISECFPEEREKVKILDIACGSGTLGELLKKQGFYNIDGLDPSDGMLKLAKEKKCYNNLYCEFMTSNVPIQKGTYDCAAVVGGMGEGHIPCEGLHIMAHIVKPGGYVVIVMRLEYIQHVEEYKDRLEPLMQQMEDQGIWVMESRTIVERYAFGNDGVIFKFRVC